MLVPRNTTLLWAACGVAALAATAHADDGLELFETQIRPLLIAECSECHNSHGEAAADLALDFREPLRAPREGGALVVPGDPAASRLLAILRHEVEGLEMPQGRPPLSAAAIDAFERWISAGAPDPRDAPPPADVAPAGEAWEAAFQQRLAWWSFQPIATAAPPATNPGHSVHPVDRFLDARLQQEGLTPAPEADPETLIRRLHFVLWGLPPEPQVVATWAARLRGATSAADRDRFWGALVDELLSDRRYAERWARHWMDWIRYAESHGSEGDPPLTEAWRYRDYLIRALEDDVPYDQLLREHVAGDLLARPRWNEAQGWNESAIGTSHWRMVFHGFAPTDALDEKVRFVDDQINAFTKATLGLTVSCARCHDHKFDPISQRDYYAMFAVLSACRPGRLVIDAPERLQRHAQDMTALKQQIRAALVADWQAALPAAVDAWCARVATTEADAASPLAAPLVAAQRAVAQGESLAAAWSALVAERRADRVAAEAAADEALVAWNLADAHDYAAWGRTGNGLAAAPSPAGEWVVAPAGETALAGIYPAGVYSHRLSDKHAARLTSPDVALDEPAEVWALACGDGSASVRYAVHDYPRDGTVYPVARPGPTWQWVRFDVSYWQGDSIYVELAAARDAPLLNQPRDRSWFGIRAAAVVRPGQTLPRIERECLAPLLEEAADAPQSVAEVQQRYRAALCAAVEAWSRGAASDAQAALLDAALRAGALPNRLDELSRTAPLVAQYRQYEQDVPTPTRVPGLEETRGRRQSLYVRGDHRQPGEETPPRFLSAVDATPYEAHRPSRLQLADDLVRADNPFPRRVIVNRLWQQAFGTGLVRTSDNFGRLGEAPTHPELLDWLAQRFADDGWSLRRTLRLLVTSAAWRRSSTADADVLQCDPENRLLARAAVRRLDAEAVRDSLLCAAGALDPTSFGPPVDGAAPRRSVYVAVRRNALDPLLRTFDFPEPFSTVGRRDATNVPAQSLALLNDPEVVRRAREFAQRVAADDRLESDEARIDQMVQILYGRRATAAETADARQFLRASREEAQARQAARDARAAAATELRAGIAALTDPVRARLQQSRRDASAAPPYAPLATWDFAQGAAALDGPVPLTLHGPARLARGALTLEPGGYALSAPLPQPLQEKTLEAWVRLATLDQQGGGALTVQSLDGALFDAIVFAEQQPRRWLAGSNGFARTQSFDGTPEHEAGERPVQVAIAYAADGQIVGYRNGAPYGRAYRSDGPLAFAAGEALVGLGVRHLPAGGNRMLAGEVLAARVFDRALTDADVRRLYEAAPWAVDDAAVRAALTADEQARWARDAAALAEHETALAALAGEGEPEGDLGPWSELAHALLLQQEFLYVR